MIRLFVGLELPTATRQALGLLRGGVDGARWQTDAQYHLTLRFIGEVEARRAGEIADALGSIRFTPFALDIEGLGIFGKVRKPRALWVGVRDPAPLKHLHEKIDQALVRVGIAPEERKYRPHVTLARFRGRSGRLERYLVDHQDFVTPRISVDHFALFSSHLGHEGARYVVEARFGASGVEAIEDALHLAEIAAAEEADMDQEWP